MALLSRTASRAWGRYSQWLGDKPLSANIWTSGVIVGVGDYFAQSIEQESIRPDTKNWTRVIALSSWGFVTGGPMYYWYRYLDKLWPPKGLSSVGAVLKKTFGNQVVMAPLMNTLFFIYATSVSRSVDTILNPTSPRFNSTLEVEIERKLSVQLLPTVTTSLFYWIPVHLVNFSFVPSKYRVLYLSMGLWGWSTYLSIVAHRDHTHEAEEKVVATTIEGVDERDSM
uniref:Uncharacterized protein n=1 Tax=Palpitomonas bilix TaxID=652834 RepID=A0A7S3CVP4_9EUKA|mmetsp:Transcript_10890/g.28573  ORF Transcript_10890/g.28573 Transcript_10890/m.28573 type:complete len:226 (+) Transcript_10890:128-805(+)